MKPVADEKPAAYEEILATEYRALRPDAGFEIGDEKDLIARMHRDPQQLAALCISGGGIRSATFALGIIQGLPPLVGADLVELNPVRDPQGITAALAAKLVKELATQLLGGPRPA